MTPREPSAWARVVTSRDREALSLLCRTFRAPLVAALRALGLSATERPALLVMLHATVESGMASAHPDFRAFALAELARFAQARGMEAAVQAGVDAFDRAFEVALFARAIARLRFEATRVGRGALVARLEPLLRAPEPEAGVRRAGVDLALSDEAVAVTLPRLRARLLELLRAELDETCIDTKAVDAELSRMLGPGYT